MSTGAEGNGHRARRRKTRHGRDKESGAILLLSTFTLLMIIPMAGMAIDAGIGYIVKTRLSVAVDAACLAGARSLHRGAGFEEQKAYAATVAERYFNANFRAGEWATTGPAPTIDVAQGAYRERIVTVSATRTVPLYFMRILGEEYVSVGIVGQARRRDSNIILILDRSWSMGNTASVPPMKKAAKKFVDRFANGQDRLGLITFKGSVDRAMEPTLYFKSQSPSAATLIDQIKSGGSTGTTAALNTAYDMLQTINEPGALNVIVFFTDGLPNGIVARWYDRPGEKIFRDTSPCDDKDDDDRIGFISQSGGGANSDNKNTNGIYKWLENSRTTTSESQISSSLLDDCYMRGNAGRMSDDIEKIPEIDYFGNRTFGFTGAVSGVDLYKTKNPWHIKYISMNTAIDQGARIRADAALKPVIFVIELGDPDADEPPDPIFMRKLANTPDSLTYNSSQESGQYIQVQVSEQDSKLEEAFNQIAVEIIRLSL